MNQNLIDRYKIYFENKLMIHPGFSAYYRKVVDTNMPCLTDFLNDWSAAEIEENLLITNINQVLNGTIPEFEIGSETIYIYIRPNITFFYMNYNDNIETNDQMPTQDFREIVVAWKDYLNS